jgi:hypothetical protein
MLHTRVWKRKSYVVAICVAMTLMQACSNGGSQQFEPVLTPVSPNHPLASQWLDGGATQEKLNTVSSLPTAIYIADALLNTVDVYDAHGNLTGTIADSVQNPAGLLVDGNQNLWVANSTYVSMYPKAQMKPARTLQDPNGSPDDVSVAKDGTVYVSNFFNSSVSVYAPGSNLPTRMLRDSKAQYVVGVVGDPDGNVFATINDSTGVGHIDEFVDGKQSGFKRLPPRFSWAADIKLDSAGNLLVLDGTQLSITEFTKAGRPTGRSMSTFYQWNAFDISRDDKYIAGTDSLPDHDRGVLEEFPSSKHIARFENNYGGGLTGAAVAPGRFP